MGESCYVTVECYDPYVKLALECNDPYVKLAFDVFAEIMLVIIGVVCDDDHSHPQENDNIQEFRNFLNRLKGIQSLSISSCCC